MSAAFEPATLTTERGRTSGRSATKLPDGVPAAKRGATSEITHKRAAVKPRATPEVPNKGSVSKTADEPVSKTPVEAAEPRAGTDKNTTDEELGTVVAIRCAGIRIIPVVAVRAYRWWKVAVTGPYEYADRNVCRITRGWDHQNTQDGKILEILHFSTPRSDPKYLPQIAPDLKNLQESLARLKGCLSMRW
jgi:hypothetical protein